MPIAVSWKLDSPETVHLIFVTFTYKKERHLKNWRAVKKEMHKIGTESMRTKIVELDPRCAMRANVFMYLNSHFIAHQTFTLRAELYEELISGQYCVP